MKHEHSPQGRIYLDLDGVIYPIAQAPENDPDIEQLHAYEWWRKSVVDRLGKLGAEIVLASSWGEAFMKSTIRSPELHSIRALNEKAIARDSKITVIQQDLELHPVEQVVWIDDAINDDAMQQLRKSANEPLVIIPEKSVGLTLDDLVTIDAYLRK